MNRETLLAVILTTSACAVAPVDDGPKQVTVAQEVAGDGKCRPSLCGLNAGALTDGYFHELNLDGLANDEGFSIDRATKGTTRYIVNVVNGKITATSISIGPPTILTGQALAGLVIRLKRVVNNVTSYRLLSIESVSYANYWAKPGGVATSQRVETYKFFYRGENNPIGDWVCNNGDLYHDPTEPVRAMSEHHALVFEGDRIDVEDLRVAQYHAVSNPPSRWFTIGCAETALAKMHLNGHTKASHHVGFSNTALQRQTFLKMIMADYCGNGHSFTVTGQRLRWSDSAGTMTIPSTFGKELEARWDENGALCLNTPRVDAHPTSESRAHFEEGIETAIDLVCGIGNRPPPCPTLSTGSYLRSWNPTPFTN
jgi:hypothetical protein